MNITAIQSNNYFNKYSSNMYNSKSPSFKGAISENSAERAFEMLKSKLSSVKIASDDSGLKDVMDNLIKKWNGISLTRNSVGIMDIPDNEIVDFLGEKGKNIITKDKSVVCVAIGDKYAPVTMWDKCYEAVAVLIPKSNM